MPPSAAIAAPMVARVASASRGRRRRRHRRSTLRWQQPRPPTRRSGRRWRPPRRRWRRWRRRCPWRPRSRWLGDRRADRSSPHRYGRAGSVTARHGHRGHHVFELPRSRHHPPMKVRDPVLRIVTAMLTACFGGSVLRLAVVPAGLSVVRRLRPASVALRRRSSCRGTAGSCRRGRTSSRRCRPRDQHPAFERDAPARLGGDRFPDAGGRDGHEIGRSAWLDPGRRVADRSAGSRRDRGKGFVGQEVSGQDHQGRRLERVAASHRVERVLQVVGTGGHVDPRRPQCCDRSQPARHGHLPVTSLQEEVGVGERDDADTGGGDRFGDAALHAMRAGRRGSRNGWP